MTDRQTDRQTDCMAQSPSWGANISSVIPAIPHIKPRSLLPRSQELVESWLREYNTTILPAILVFSLTNLFPLIVPYVLISFLFYYLLTTLPSSSSSLPLYFKLSPFFLISNFRRVLNIVYNLLGISPASTCCPTPLPIGPATSSKTSSPV